MTTLIHTSLTTNALAGQCHWVKLLGTGGFGRVDQVVWKNERVSQLSVHLVFFQLTLPQSFVL